MGKDSKIEWTHHTFNPWWGCVRVSPGCEHCYAEGFARRVGQKVWGVQAPRRFFGEKHWREPLKWDLAAQRADERRRVFCASMADVFEDRRDLDVERERLFELINQTKHLDWLLLTKRPENIAKLSPFGGAAWHNVWLGVTAEDQRRADERIPELLKARAAVRFVSYEPALGPVDFSRFVRWRIQTDSGANFPYRPHVHELPAVGGSRGLDWIIVGGESGPGARPFDSRWALDVIRQCRDSGAACFVKQMGASVWAGDPDTGSRVQVRLRDAKGGDMTEWPDDLRVREWPLSHLSQKIALKQDETSISG